MSIDTWIKEFYTPAGECKTIAEVLKHDIKKMTGFLPENLEKHKVTSVELWKAGLAFSDSCGLCYMFSHQCKNCPLTLAGNCCDKCVGCEKLEGEEDCEATCEKQSLWNIAYTDPRPLIAELKKLLEEEIKKGE